MSLSFYTHTSQTSRWPLGRWLPGLLGAIALTLNGPAAIAQTLTAEETPLPQDKMFEELLEMPSNYSEGLEFFSEASDDWPVQTSRDTSLFEPTLPSLWWSRDQLPNRWQMADQSIVRVEGYRLVRDWISFHSQSADAYVIDIQVDPQYWNRFSYFQKYAILNQLGTTGMSFGYHVRVYSSISLVGVHACDFSGVPEFVRSPGKEVPVPELSNVLCSVAVGPFVSYAIPTFEEDLFAPP